MGMIEELQELQRKAERYNILKANIDQAEKKINEAIKILQESLTSINPIIKIKEQKNTEGRIPKINNIQLKEALEEQFNKLRTGLHVNIISLKTDYPEWNDDRCKNFINNRIKAIPKIQVTKIQGKNGINMNSYFLDGTI